METTEVTIYLKIPKTDIDYSDVYEYLDVLMSDGSLDYYIYIHDEEEEDEEV